MRNNALTIVMMVLILTTSRTAATAQTQKSVQVGVWGDDASRGNLGVRVEIRTHSYEAHPTVLDYFWVGNNLENGAFIQFGYGLEPGYYCLKGSFVGGNADCEGIHELVEGSDARWQWQYWPDLRRRDFYYEIGPSRSAGMNGTWHLYSILPNAEGEWDLILDNERVANVAFHSVRSNDPAYIVAEKGYSLELAGNLGPAEFRNLGYLKEDGWHTSESLVALRACTVSAICGSHFPYGVAVTAPGQIIAGSSIEGVPNGELVWTSGFFTLNVDVGSGNGFYVGSVMGARPFESSASVEIPRNMFAHVSLLSSKTPTPGVLGMLGAEDEFHAWVGDVSSKNESIRLLMDRDRSIKATWSTSFYGLQPTIILALVLILSLIVVLIAFSVRRKGRRALSMRPAS